MGKIKFIRGTPRELYRSAISHFIDDFKRSPLEVGLIVPRPGMAMDIRSNLLRGHTVPTFCVTDIDDLTHYLFDQNEKVLRPVGGLGLRNIIRYILLENAQRFPSLLKDGEVQEGILDDLYTLARTLRDFQADLSDFKMDEVMGVDIPLFLSLYQRKLEELGLVDAIGKRTTVVSKAKEWSSERPFFRKLVILGPFDPTPSQVAVLGALIEGSEEVVYHHPYVPGNGKVFRYATIDLGVDLEVEDLPVSADEEGRLYPIRAWGEEDRADLTATVRLGRFLDPLSETRQVAQRISKLLDGGEDPDSIAIFLPDRRGALPLVRQVLEDFSIPFKTDLGVPLSTSPAVQTAVGVLEAVAQDYDPSAMIRLLSSPYVKWSFDGEDLWHVEVDRFARMAGVLRGWESWSHRLQDLIDDLIQQCLDPEVPDVRKRFMQKDAERVQRVKRSLEAFFSELKVLEGSKTFPKHLRCFKRSLKELGMAEIMEHSRWKDPDSMEGRAFGKLLGLLDHLEQEGASLNLERIPLSQFISDLKREIGELSFYPGGRYDRAVNVAGYRSLAGRAFKHSFLLSTLEGDMPKLGVRHPFMTAAQAKRMGLLAEDDILRQERYYFLNALLCGGSVSISYPAYQGGKKVLPSPFLSDLEKNCLVSKLDEIPVTHSMRRGHISLGNSLTGAVTEGKDEWLDRSTISPQELCERLNVERVERQGPYGSEHDGVLSPGATLDELNGKIKGKVFSATMLETYRRCPLSYFLRYVLYLSPLEGEEDSEALRVGNAAHQILFRFYRDRIAQGKGMPTDGEMEEAKAEMRRIGAEVCQGEALSAESEANIRSLLGDEEMNGMLGKFIDRQSEADRPRWSPAHLEYSFGSPFSKERNDAASTEEPVSIRLSEDPEDRILLRGKVDRIDVDGDDFLIIDYKTGAVPTFTSMHKGYNMQLPLYLMACEQLLDMEPAGGAYYQLKNDQKFGMHLQLGSQKRRDALGGSNTAYKNGLQNDLATCRRNVKEVLQGISAGEFHPVDSSEAGRCSQYCLFSRICRKDEMRILQMSLAREVE